MTKYYDWVARHAAAFPNRVAVRDFGAGRTLTYAEFDRRADRLARWLQANGVAKGDRVAMLCTNGSEFFELQYACGRTGAIAVLLNWRLTRDELSYILGDSGPRLMLHHAAFRTMAESLRAAGGPQRLLEIDALRADSPYEAALAADLPPLAPVEVALSDPSAIMYTSGTTGRPKGAIITHGMNVWAAVNIGVPFRVTPDSAQLVVGPLFHNGGYNCFGNAIFHAGGSVGLTPRFDPGEALRIIGDPAYGITHHNSGPALCRMMAEHEAFAATDFSRLKVWVTGGAPCPPDVLAALAGRGVFLQQVYGMTEAPVPVAVTEVEDARRKPGSAGLPLVHTGVRIVGADGRDVAPGEAGEIWISGPNVTPGYWNNPEATAAAFEGEWLKSGDVGRRDPDGFVYIVDRWRDMYISGGENVYPAEVERVLSGLAGVGEVAVVGVPSVKWGETGLAAIVPAPGATLDEAAVVAYCRERLAAYKAPSHVIFTEALPRNASEKVLKHRIREQFAQRPAASV